MQTLSFREVYEVFDYLNLLYIGLTHISYHTSRDQNKNLLNK